MARFQADTHIHAPPEEVFAWHEAPRALGRLIPRFEPVQVEQAPPSLRDGSVAILRIPAAPGITLRWVAEHRAYDPPRSFVDAQRSGPFKSWIHTHSISPADDGGSTLTDSIEYEPPLGPLGRAFGAPIVRKKLTRMFAYRHAITREDIALNQRLALTPTKNAGRVLITGARGTIGRVVCDLLENAGFEVTRLVRRETRAPNEAAWDPISGTVQDGALDSAAALIHLAGEPVLKGRLTPARLEEVRRSRVEGTRTLVRAMQQCDTPPAVFACASATGAYGSPGDADLTESAPFGDGPIGTLCREWEQAALGAQDLGVRTVLARFGVVISAEGGAFRSMRRLFASLLGGPIGPASAWVPWVGIDDAASAVLHAIATPNLQGPINVVGPTPATMGELARTTARAMRRPSHIGVPAVAVRARFGPAADETALASQRVIPKALTDSGYLFRCSTIDQSVRRELGTLRAE